MSSYRILPYSQEQAKKLGVHIKPSTNPKKKIDVFRGKEKVASIGDIHYDDYPTHIKKKGKEYADERRRLYHIRHHDGPKDSPAFLSKRLLW